MRCNEANTTRFISGKKWKLLFPRCWLTGTTSRREVVFVLPNTVPSTSAYLCIDIEFICSSPFFLHPPFLDRSNPFLVLRSSTSLLWSAKLNNHFCTFTSHGFVHCYTLNDSPRLFCWILFSRFIVAHDKIVGALASNFSALESTGDVPIYDLLKSV